MTDIYESSFANSSFVKNNFDYAVIFNFMKFIKSNEKSQ